MNINGLFFLFFTRKRLGTRVMISMIQCLSFWGDGGGRRANEL